MIDLSAYPIHDGIHIISPPSDIAANRGIGDANESSLLSGFGAWQVAKSQFARPIETVLEICAGAADCTMGLASRLPSSKFLITDPDLQPLSRLRTQLAQLVQFEGRFQFATLRAEEIDRLTGARFDVILATSVLHRIADWRSFLRNAAGPLNEDGLLMMQASFREGNMLMALALDFVLSPFWPANASFTAADEAKLCAVRDSIYARANTPKGEDGKRLQILLADELFHAAQAAGYAPALLYRNSHFLCLGDAMAGRLSGYCSIVEYMESFLVDHHKLSPEAIGLLSKHLYPVLQNLEATYTHCNGPALLGVVSLQKMRQSSSLKFPSIPKDWIRKLAALAEHPRSNLVRWAARISRAMPPDQSDAGLHPKPQNDAADALTELYENMRASEMNRWVGQADPRHVGECSCRALMRVFPDLSGKTILDYGCGIGRTSASILSKIGASGVLVGVDIVPKLVEYCQQNITPIFANSSFYCMDIANDHYDQFRDKEGVVPIGVGDFAQLFTKYFDIACAFSVLTHQTPEGAKQCLQSIFASLKPGGYAFITCLLLNDFSIKQVEDKKAQWNFDLERLKNTKDVFYALPKDKLNIVAHDMAYLVNLITSIGFVPESITFGGWSRGLATDFEQEIIVCQRPSTTTVA